MKTKSKMPNVSVLEFYKDDFYIIFSPSLELMAYSKTKKKVKQNFEEMLLSLCTSLSDTDMNNPININDSDISKKSLKDITQKFTFLENIENISLNSFPVKSAVVNA